MREQITCLHPSTLSCPRYYSGGTNRQKANLGYIINNDMLQSNNVSPGVIDGIDHGTIDKFSFTFRNSLSHNERKVEISQRHRIRTLHDTRPLHVSNQKAMVMP